MATAINVISLFLYLVSFGMLLREIKQQQIPSKALVVSLVSACLLTHAVGIELLAHNSESIDIHIFKMFSLIVWITLFIVFLTAFFSPVQSLYVFLLPIAAGSVAVSLLPHKETPLATDLGVGLIFHIIFSIVAYCLIGIATFQALLWSWQNQRVKQHKMIGAMKLLPPLQTMEQLMFTVLWVGEILLLAGITLGFAFVDQIFEQQLIHKTVLSLLACLIFAIILWGRVVNGWRGALAVKWILGGYSLLMLSYFGTKVVIELLLVG